MCPFEHLIKNCESQCLFAKIGAASEGGCLCQSERGSLVACYQKIEDIKRSPAPSILPILISDNLDLSSYQLQQQIQIYLCP